MHGTDQDEDEVRRVRELLETVRKVIDVLDGLEKRLRKEDDPDGILVGACRRELTRRADAFLIDTQVLEVKKPRGHEE